MKEEESKEVKQSIEDNEGKKQVASEAEPPVESTVETETEARIELELIEVEPEVDREPETAFCSSSGSLSSSTSSSSVASSDIVLNPDKCHSHEEDHFSQTKNFEHDLGRAVDRLVPKEFRNIPHSIVRGNGFFSRVTYDPTYLNTYTAKTQFVVMLLVLMLVLLTTIDGKCGDTTRQQVTDCLMASILFLVSFITFLVLLLLVLCYVFHFVENFLRFPWLVFEYIFYATAALLNFILSVLIFSYGGLYIVAGILGLITVVALYILYAVKEGKASRKEPAQTTLIDPDGNEFRALFPNCRFKSKRKAVSANSRTGNRFRFM